MKEKKVHLLASVWVSGATATVVDFSSDFPSSSSLTNWLLLALGFRWKRSLNTPLLSIQTIYLGLRGPISTVESGLFGKQIRAIRLKARGPFDCAWWRNRSGSSVRAEVNGDCWIDWYTDCPCGLPRAMRIRVSATRRTTTGNFYFIFIFLPQFSNFYFKWVLTFF